MNSPPKLLPVGDVMVGRLVNERLLTQLPEYSWGDTLPLRGNSRLKDGLSQQPLESTATWMAGEVPETFPSGV